MSCGRKQSNFLIKQRDFSEHKAAAAMLILKVNAFTKKNKLTNIWRRPWGHRITRKRSDGSTNSPEFTTVNVDPTAVALLDPGEKPDWQDERANERARLAGHVIYLTNGKEYPWGAGFANPKRPVASGKSRGAETFGMAGLC